MAKKKILLFGGTFNPIHNGHLIVSRYIGEQLGMNKVVIIPNGHPPHKEKSISSTHRYNMIKAAVSEGDNVDTFFDICRYEIEKKTPSYAIETVRYFKRTLGDTIDQPYWVIGPDNVDDIKNWYKIDELKKECIFVVGVNIPTISAFQSTHQRTLEGFDIKTVIIPHIDIRSTDIRDRVKQGLLIRHYVPDAVEEYIGENGLYRTN